MVKSSSRGDDMPKRAATAITLSERQARILTGFSNSRTLGVNLNIRSKIVLLAHEGISSSEIRRMLGVDRNTIRRWRDRFAARSPDLKRIESDEPHKLILIPIKNLEKTSAARQQLG